jgi:Tol biopolymer transport system component
LVYEDLHALSPDGKTLALTDGEGRQAWTHKKITVIDLDTGKASALTGKDVAALYPTWSPKGDAIAFVAGPDAGDVWGGDQAEKALNQRHL